MKIENTTVARDFKLMVVAISVFLTGFHIFEIIYFPYQRIVSDKVILSVMLVLLVYLWIQEIRDRQALEKGYNKLINVQDKLRKTNLKTIRSLALAEEAKNTYARGHSTRVASYSYTIAKKLGFSREELTTLENASILHDIGKMGIADVILEKKGKLNKEEWVIVKKHPELALEILSPLEFLTDEKEIIKHHHERYDGSGYPDGIRGNAIPIGARILAVTDAFDAMRSHRPYRAPLSDEAVIAELEKNSGSQFDSKIVSVLLEIIEECKGVL